MQIGDSEAGRSAGIEVRTSLAVELAWVLSGAESDYLRTAHPVVDSLYGEDPELEGRVRSFWSAGDRCYSELLVLAQQGGSLTGARGIDELVDSVLGAAVSPPAELRLATETPDVRAEILGRVDRLRRSSRLRSSYAALLRDVWSPVEAHWARSGRRASDAACAALGREVSRGARWQDLVREECELARNLLPGMSELVGPGDPVVLVPAAYSGKLMLLDLPGAFLVGVPASTGTGTRRDELAARLKTLADPTRLAIVELAARRACTVGEAARAVGVAQPTVSNHVKLLRDAGLLAVERRGTRRELVVRADALGGLLEELRAVAAVERAVPGAPVGD
jgi:ArsR family transcriptional regulator